MALAACWTPPAIRRFPGRWGRARMNWLRSQIWDRDRGMSPGGVALGQLLALVDVVAHGRLVAGEGDAMLAAPRRQLPGQHVGPDQGQAGAAAAQGRRAVGGV